jgi:hypothetical protein
VRTEKVVQIEENKNRGFGRFHGFGEGRIRSRGFPGLARGMEAF